MTERLQAGQRAPLFTGETWSGQSIDLQQYRGQKLWLAFFRYATCPLCNLRVHQMIQRASELEGLQVLAVFESHPQAMAEAVGKQQPPFPLLADPHSTLYQLYRLETSVKGLLSLDNAKAGFQAARLGFLPGMADGPLSRLPADFLIDEQGMLVQCHYSTRAGEHIDWATVLAFRASPASPAQGVAMPQTPVVNP